MHANRPITLEVLLSYAPLFEGLEQEALDRIARCTAGIRLFRNDPLFEKGSVCDGFHLVVHGQIKLSFVSDQGTEKIMDILGPDRTFGETLMFAGQPYVVSARALSDALVLHVPKTAILDEFETSPRLRLKLLTLMSAHLHELMADGQRSSQQSGTERFIAYLLRQLPKGTPNERDVVVTLPTSKGNISSLLNLTKEHLSRILRALSQRGLIAVAGCQIFIPDMARLIGYRDGAEAS